MFVGDYNISKAITSGLQIGTEHDTDNPQISHLGKNFGVGSPGSENKPVHDRLYEKGIEKITSHREKIVSFLCNFHMIVTSLIKCN